MSEAKPLAASVRRASTKHGGYSATLDGTTLTIASGTHADAYGPVEIEIFELDQFITDLRSLLRVGKRDAP